MPGTPSVSQFMYRRFLHLPLPYRQFFRDGSVDGVIMVRYDFSNYFTSEITGGHPVKLGIFRELSHLTSGSSQYVSSEYNMRRDFTEISTNPKLSEVELYEALILTQKPEVLKIISDLTNSTTGKRITEK
jgi:hypothetical protein